LFLKYSKFAAKPLAPPDPAVVASTSKDADIPRQILPASTAPQNPENPFQHATIPNPRAATPAMLLRFREQGRDFLPLRFGQ